MKRHFYELQNNFLIKSMVEFIQSEGIKRKLWLDSNKDDHVAVDFNSFMDKNLKINTNKGFASLNYGILVYFLEKRNIASDEVTVYENTSFQFSDIVFSITLFSTKLNTVTSFLNGNPDKVIFGVNDLYTFTSSIFEAFNQNKVTKNLKTDLKDYIKNIYFDIDAFIRDSDNPIKDSNGAYLNSYDFLEFQKEFYCERNVDILEFKETDANSYHKIDFTASLKYVRRKDVPDVFEDKMYRIDEFYPDLNTSQEIPVINSTNPKYVNH